MRPSTTAIIYYGEIPYSEILIFKPMLSSCGIVLLDNSTRNHRPNVGSYYEKSFVKHKK